MAALFSLVQTLLSLNKCNQISCCLCLKPHAIHSAFCYKFLEHKFMILILSRVLLNQDFSLAVVGGIILWTINPPLILGQGVVQFIILFCPRLELLLVDRIYMLFAGLGPYSRLRAQFFPIRTNLGRQIMFIFFFRRVLCRQFLCWIFTAAIFKPGVGACVWHLGNRK